MARRSFVVLAALAGTLALGTVPALAKGGQGPPHPWRCPEGGNPYCPPGTVTITGPGLADPVSIGARDFWKVLYLTGEAFRPWGMPDPSPTVSELGPRYAATYAVRLSRHRTLSMSQDLYPYAPGMVWANTPSGQLFHDTFQRYTAPGGWWHSTALLDVLIAHGLPAVAPAEAASETTQASAPALRAGPASGGGRVWIGVAALAALLVLGAAAGRPRRAPAGQVRG